MVFDTVRMGSGGRVGERSIGDSASLMEFARSMRDVRASERVAVLPSRLARDLRSPATTTVFPRLKGSSSSGSVVRGSRRCAGSAGTGGGEARATVGMGERAEYTESDEAADGSPEAGATCDEWEVGMEGGCGMDTRRGGEDVKSRGSTRGPSSYSSSSSTGTSCIGRSGDCS
jgi:hypothetical protein